MSTVAIFIPHTSMWVRAMIALSLVLVYFIYLMLTIRASAKLVADGHGTAASEPLFLVRLFGRIGMPENMFTILLQLAIGLTLIIFGAHGFVQGVEQLSVWLGLSALVLSLLIVPVATELPEKVNSILWIRKRKDTLAFGNITGAMVFQGSLLPALGILLTPWEPRQEVLAGRGPDAGGEFLSAVHGAPRPPAAGASVFQRLLLSLLPRYRSDIGAACRRRGQ